jgi:hypothetical protein
VRDPAAASLPVRLRKPHRTGGGHVEARGLVLGSSLAGRGTFAPAGEELVETA